MRYHSSPESMSRIDQLVAVHTEARRVFERKNEDYGDAFARYGPVGVLVRLGDKIARLQNVTQSGITMNVEDESVRDTLLDLHNYSAMALMLMDEGKSTASAPSPSALRAWRIHTAAVQANGTHDVVVRETRDAMGTIRRECDCTTFTKDRLCIHSADTHNLPGSSYEVANQIDA